MNQTCTITRQQTYSIHEIYGSNNPTIPKGYKAKSFDDPKASEYFLTSDGKTVYQCPANRETWGGVRIILEKLPPAVTFTPTGETRLAKKGEWYKYDLGFAQAQVDHTNNNFPVSIYTRTES